MHGGARGSGAPRGERNGNYRHGRATVEALRRGRYLRRRLRWLGKVTNLFIAQFPPEARQRGDVRVALPPSLAMEGVLLDIEAAQIGIHDRD